MSSKKLMERVLDAYNGIPEIRESYITDMLMHGARTGAKYVKFDSLNDQEISWLREQGFQVQKTTHEVSDRGHVFEEWGWMVRWTS